MMNMDMDQTPDTAEEQVPEPEATETPEPEAAAGEPGVVETPEATAAEWQAALELAVQQRDEYKDSWLRTKAEFQNFQRRTATARSDGYEEGVREALTAVLPAIDNLERAISAAEKTEGGEALVDGVRMTLNTLMEGLKRFGFEEVPALGEEFDPEKHNAVMQEPGDEPGRILDVFQKGYRVKDRIIRYAMVKVASEA